MEFSGVMNDPVLKTSEGKICFPSEQRLEAFANKFASVLQVPLVIHLKGDLGAGKTAFARALIHALGYEGRVKSPTYGLLEQYLLPALQVLHLDLYRISDPGELEFLGLEDLMDEQCVVLIEWPDRGGAWLPEADFIFHFSYAEPGRDLRWRSLSRQAEKVISEFLNT